MNCQTALDQYQKPKLYLEKSDPEMIQAQAYTGMPEIASPVKTI
jgi:hypothetical protein